MLTYVHLYSMTLKERYNYLSAYIPCVEEVEPNVFVVFAGGFATTDEHITAGLAWKEHHENMCLYSNYVANGYEECSICRANMTQSGICEACYSTLN